MKRLVIASLLLCLLCTCKKNPYADLCGGKYPIKALPWLKVKIELLQNNNDEPRISRVNYQGRTIFVVGFTCCPACSCFGYFLSVNECDGTPIQLNIDQQLDILTNYLPKAQLIWKK